MALDQYALTTLSNIKAVLEISNTNDDALLEKLIERASDWIERYCDRQFKSRERNEYLTGDDTGILYPRHWPILEVILVNYDPGYSWKGPDVSGQDIIVQETCISCVGRSFSRSYPGAVKLVYEAGYEAVPDDLEHACIVLVGQMFKQSKADRFGVDGQVMPSALGGGSATFIHELPPDVAQILGKHKRAAL